jgi:hypothetical protein
MQGKENKGEQVPKFLKGVALFLGAIGVLALVMSFIGPAVVPNEWRGPALLLGHWSYLYAVLLLLLSMGVWRRRPWAWWGVLLFLGLSVISSYFVSVEHTSMLQSPFARVMFGVLWLFAGAYLARSWYAQRKHFLWAGVLEADNPRS